MNDEITVPSEAAVTEATEPPATEVSETVPETTDGTVAAESTVPETFSEETFPVGTFHEDSLSAETFPMVTEATIWEDFSGSVIQETVAETTEPVVIVDVIEMVGSDLANVILFGAFMVCGALIGLHLLRDRHGN